uniref:Glucosylceramidase n=1 Tax=Timema monikensis TaxID=170555 RepID=A0A7R9EF41_9NEOP|nr:unnamed protein product [Timema monikensis]
MPTQLREGPWPFGNLIEGNIFTAHVKSTQDVRCTHVTFYPASVLFSRYREGASDGIVSFFHAASVSKQTGLARECAVRDYGASSIVCVCNSTYCDSLEPIGEENISGGHYLHYVSSKAGRRLEMNAGTFKTGDPPSDPLSDPLHHHLRHPLSDPLSDPLPHTLSIPLSDPLPHPLIDPLCDPLSDPQIDSLPHPLSDPQIDPLPHPLSDPLLHALSDPLSAPCDVDDNTDYLYLSSRPRTMMVGLSVMVQLDNVFLKQQSARISTVQTIEMNETVPTFTVDKETKYQEIFGFGAALTDSTALNIKNLSDATTEVLLNTYFGKGGSNYLYLRVPMGACDFSTLYYSYDDVQGDTEWEHFDLIDNDYQLKVPIIKRASELRGETIKLFATPWSAPWWMKINGTTKGIAHLDEQYYQPWANYFLK